MTQALEGIRVIDFTHDQAGPSCTQMLAWLGADVIKIENPKGGDRARRLWNSDNPDVDSFFFLLLNSNKRSTVIDLKAAEGKEIARRLIKEADVVAENLGPRVKFTGTLATGEPLRRSGNRSPTGGYSDLIRCAPSKSEGGGVDDYIYIIVPPDNPEMFHAAMEVIGRPELKEDARFKTPAARAKNAAALTEVLESWTVSRNKHDVMKAFAGRGMVCGAVLDTAEVLKDPHLRDGGTIVDLGHPTAGRSSPVISPLRLSDSPVTPRRAPLFGEHSEEVLRSLAGYTADEIAALKQKGVVTQG